MGEKKYVLEYYDGNAVRDFPLENPVHKNKNQNRAKKKRKKQVVFSGWYMIVLSVAIISVLAMCVYYIKVQSDLNGQRRKIEQLEKEVNLLMDENNVTKERLQSQVDLDYIYNVATKKLGMVYAKDNQIIYYSGQSKDYVRQYSSIPTK